MRWIGSKYDTPAGRLGACWVRQTLIDAQDTGERLTGTCGDLSTIEILHSLPQALPRRKSQRASKGAIKLSC
jgi:hypothetical protein